MKTPERIALIEVLPYESRIGFVAFCVERCLNEARRHPWANKQLEKLPILTEGLEMLWACAEEGAQPDPERIKAVLAHLSTYESPGKDRENVIYSYDVTLVDASRTLTGGLNMLLKPELTAPRYVVSALDGPVQSVGAVYADYRNARNAELTVIDNALQRLQEWGDKPFSRAVFGGIPDWRRGELSKKYAEGRWKGSAEADDE